MVFGEKNMSRIMKSTGKVAMCLAIGVALRAGAAATQSPENPYSAIVVRNVFDLKPLAPRSETKLIPPLKIILTGIVKIFREKQVFFKTLDVANPGAPPKETSFILNEGERAGEIEVLEINESEGTIRVMNRGLEQSLSLKKDGMKPPGTSGADPGSMSVVRGQSMPTLTPPAGKGPVRR